MEKKLMPHWVELDSGRAFSIKHRVRYADTDRMDVVYHGSYVPMLEAARVETLREIGWVYSEMEQNGIMLPVIDLNLKYHKPAKYDQILSVESHIVSTPTAKIHFKFYIKHESELLVSADVVLAFVDSATGRARRAPAELISALEKAKLIHG